MTPKERGALLNKLVKAGVKLRPCPVRNHIEVFTDSPTEPGFKRWVEFPVTVEALAPLVP